METSRRTQGCWTCKKRKIGCDRGFPACNNCVRTSRECLGYGIRLAWPDQPDGRRRVNRLPSQAGTTSLVSHSAHYGRQFLNVTYKDLAAAAGKSIVADAPLMIGVHERPMPAIPLIPDLKERESRLINYYRDILARMISTIDVNNGFRDDLLPIAMSNYSNASYSLRNSILALAAFHLWGSEQALSYKAEALRSLSTSFSADVAGNTQAQLAASMMLCVYNVFDESEGNWTLHLNGAQTILHQLVLFQGDPLQYKFLYTWFLYHEILGAFSQPVPQESSGRASLQLLYNSDFDRTVIIGSLGCSMEVMEIISYVNNLRATQQDEDWGATPDARMRRAEELHEIERKITSLTQHLDSHDASCLTIREQTRVLATAELYRVAVFLYLQRACNNAEMEEHRRIYLQQAFSMLDSMETCTSPWPLFVIACESETDEQRIKILQTLDLMDKTRHIGNIFVLRTLIESFWKRLDLQADNGPSSGLKWWDVIDLKTAGPWFI